MDDSNRIVYTFDNNNNFTYTSGENWHHKKYQYTYNENTKELSLKLTHKKYLLGTEEWHWCTFSQIAEFWNNYSYSDYVNEMNQTGEQILSETEFQQEVQQWVQYEMDGEISDYEKLTVYKAEVNSSQELEIRTKYYQTAPTRLPYSEDLFFSLLDESIQNYHSFSSRIRNAASEEKSYISYSSSNYYFTNITSDTISAKEGVRSSGNYIYTEPENVLLITYSNLRLGNDHNIVVTLSAADDHTRTYFTNWFGNNSITLTTSTSPETYTLQH